MRFRGPSVLVAAVVGMILGLAAPAFAGEMPAAMIPGAARWVMHVNLDAAKESPLWEIIRRQAIEPRSQEVNRVSAAIELATGTRLLQDVRDVTLFGTAFDGESVGLVIRASMNRDRVMASLRRDPEFKTTEHNGHTLFTWRRDRDPRPLNGALIQNDIALISPNMKLLMQMVDTIDGKSTPLTNPRLMPRGGGGGAEAGGGRVPIVWIASTHVADLRRAALVESPFLSHVDTASLGVGVTGERVWSRMSLLANTDKAADDFAALGTGFKAMVSLAAGEERADPRLKLLAAAMQNLTFTAAAQECSADWSMGLEHVEALIEVVRAPATGGALTRPAATMPAAGRGNR